ncbi:MAG: sigma-54 dependent transcriptional regulator [Myxococcaceae bacterium]|nr:sigma-54 dependent transcriptional regulator [Myxococcaceae bacterium]
MAAFRSILIVDDEASIRHVLSLVLKDKGYEVRAVENGEEALKELSARPYDVVVSDVRMPKVDGMTLLKTAVSLWPDITFLVMSAYGTADQALEVVAAGAFDYIQKPFKPEEVVLVLRKAEERLRLLQENRRLKAKHGGSEPLRHLLGQSESLKSIHKQIQKVAPVATTVLISGESGTGKELVARAIHELSPRATMGFVTVNCGAIPAGLIESELFGHARGAFTDARTAKRGLLAEADAGTVFLDEIGELPHASQVKLLRFLQEGEIRPVGDNKAEKVDVRVVAASLRDLSKMVERGEFREDLYFRLNVLTLRIPPLRERKEDISLLAMSFIQRFNRELNREKPVTHIGPDAMALMTAYAWPGNVRELENAMERAVLLCEGETLLPESLPEKLWAAKSEPLLSAQGVPLVPQPQAVNFSLKRAMHQLEETFIRAALRQTKGNRTRAAELLEISHRALLYKLKDYGIDADAEGETPTGG